MEISDISLLHTKVADSGLNPEKALESDDPQQLKATTEQFEAILIRQYLSEAMKPLFEGPIMGHGSGAHMYQYMITDAMASELSNNSTFGVASLLQMQLTGPEKMNPAGTINTQNHDKY